MVDCGRVRVLAGVAIGLSIALIAVVAVLIYRETTRRGDRGDDPIDESSVADIYPSYFRNKEQQASFERELSDRFYNDRTEVTEFFNGTNFCSFGCSQGGRRRKRATSQTIDHGCCRSSLVFNAPTTHNNMANNERRLLQYTIWKQFFPVHSCTQNNQCNGCTCSEEGLLFTAVVIKDGITEPEKVDDTEIDFFMLTGCCKCVTNT